MSVRSMGLSFVGRRAAAVAYRCAVHGRMTAERWTLASLPRGAEQNRRTGRILAYHSIGTAAWGVNDVAPRDFERHLQMAIDDGWTFATPAQVIAEPDKPQIALTFDDGASSVLANAAPVIRHHGIPATAFIVTGWADGRHYRGHEQVLDWDGVRALISAGIAVASHSVTHRDFGKLGPDETRRELETSRERLRGMLDIESDEFAVPFGQSRNWPAYAARAAAEAGYTTVYAQAVNTRPAGTVPRTFITRVDRPRLFRAALAGRFDSWEEWY